MQRGKEVFDIQFQDDRLADMISGIVFDAPAGTERCCGWMEFHRGKYLSQDTPLCQLQNPTWSFDCPELAVPLGYPEYLVELFRMIGYPVKQLDVDMKKPAQRRTSIAEGWCQGFARMAFFCVEAGPAT